MKIILFLLFAFWLWALILSIADKNKKQTIKLLIIFGIVVLVFGSLGTILVIQISRFLKN